MSIERRRRHWRPSADASARRLFPHHSGETRMKKTFKWTRIALTLGIIAIIAVSAYAFTNSNTVPGSYAGDGSQTISGYNVSNIAYSLNNTTPTNLDAVAFTLDAAAGT